MAEATRRSALAGHLAPGRRGVAEGVAGVQLSERRPPAMAQLHGAPHASQLRQRLNAFSLSTDPGPLRCARGEAVRLLWSGRDQYLVVSQDHQNEELVLSLSTALAGSDGTAVDVSHARTVLRVEGAACRDLLAKGCPLDVDAMMPGHCAATVISHFSVLLHCDDEQAFELYVTRSFAESLLEWLLRAAAEFGVDIAAA